MNRREEYMESLVKDLGSAYYQTLRNRAGETSPAKSAGLGRGTNQALGESGRTECGRDSGADSGDAPRSGAWRVSDVMATDVVTIDKNLPFKQVALLLAENDLRAVPVLSGGRRVLGMVSEADLLRREERSFGRLSAGLPRRTHRQRRQAAARTAGELMTAPAITIHPDAPVGAAARLMNAHRIGQLPVVNTSGELLGAVSRKHLLAVFLRPDSEIAAEIAAGIASGLGRDWPAGRPEVTVSVTDGEVVLTGELPAAAMITAAVRIASNVAGVVAVTSELNETGEPHEISERIEDRRLARPR